MRRPGTATLRRVGVMALAALAACASPEVGRRKAVENAIGRAEGYLQRRGTAIDPMMTFILARLERRWGLDWTAAQREATLAAVPASPQRRLFARLVDPAARLDPAALETITDETDRMILAALYCGEPEGAGFDAVAPLVERRGYELTHGALALGWLLEKGCVSKSDAASVRERFIAALTAIAAEQPSTDLGIEAMAMLDHLGAAGRLEPGWIDAIVAAQGDGGGWGERPRQPPLDHTTTLALWVLLAASDRPLADVPWIPAG